MALPPLPRAGLRIFLPFALGYFLSYLLRTVNAVISPVLTGELGLSAADLGLLTSTYFLAFGLAQIPVGVALDRLGPRRVEGTLLLVTAFGAASFALGDSLAALGLARALIGLGVSACLMAALSGFTRWYPRERQSSMTGFIMSAGAVGALTASVPVEAALPLMGWRAVFWIVAGVALAASVLIFRLLPDDAGPGGRESAGEALRLVAGIYLSPQFLRFAGSSLCFVGGFMALQSLWAVPWLMNVNRLDIGQAARILVLLNLGMLGGQLSIGLLGTSLARRGVTPLNLMQIGYCLVLFVELLILFDGGPPAVLWFLLGLLSAVNSQTYLASATHFPRTLFGRVSTATNLMAFAGAFLMQWGMGLTLDALKDAGYAMDTALQCVFAGLIALQGLAILPLLREARLSFRRSGESPVPAASRRDPRDG